METFATIFLISINVNIRNLSVYILQLTDCQVSSSLGRATAMSDPAQSDFDALLREVDELSAVRLALLSDPLRLQCWIDRLSVAV
jgi:hypothetical protein